MKPVAFFLLVLFLAFSAANAEGVSADSSATAKKDSAATAVTDTTAKADSSATDKEDDSESGLGWIDFLAWPFIHIVQPVFNVAVYPIAQPIHYAVDNGVIEKSVDLITFGENRNILLYPMMNLKPGTATMLGFVYRHRSIVLPKDYVVLESQFFANGDWYVSARYSKQGIGGLPLYTAFRYQQYWDRDAFFVVPGSRDKYVQPDSTIYVSWRLSGPLDSYRHWNLGSSFGMRYNDASLPEKFVDSILVDDRFPIESRGLYQSEFQFPMEISLVFDNLDYSFAPTRGRRLVLSGQYVIVNPYSGLAYDAYDSSGTRESMFYQDDAAKHDYIRTEIVFQQYILLGKSKKFHMSPAEARESRRFYSDFSLDEALRPWHPSNVMNTLLERRVLAFQFRMIDVFEMEKGEAPFNAFPTVGARFPLRGYADLFSAYHVMGFSMEYRWPIDRFVDGVIFDEYALHAPEIDEWSMDRFFNSWGFGVRVRKPDMFWFRVQIGFHGLHGINLVMTIAPEYR